MRTRVVRVLTATSAATLLLGMAACTGSSGNTASSSSSSSKQDAAKDNASSVTIAVPQVVSNWDPYVDDYTFFMQPLQASYDTLLRMKQDGTPGPGLASAYTWKNNTTLELTLRKGVLFRDGAALTPDVVKQNLDRAKTVTGPRTQEIKTVQSVSTSGDTVTLSLSTPDPTIPLALTRNMGMMVSPTALQDTASLKTEPDGTGPYTLDTQNTLVNDHYVFHYNPKYWNKDERHVGTLTFRAIVDPTAALNALRSGQIDSMGSTSANVVTAAKSAGFTIEQTVANFYGLNLQDRDGTVVPYLKNADVRRAMNYAVDRKALQTIVGAGQPTEQPYPPGQVGHDPKLDSTYSYDPTKAKQLLASAGYPDGIDLTVLSLPLQDPYMQALKQQMAAANIRITINDVPPPQYIADRNTTKTPVYFWFNTLSHSIADAKQNLLPTAPYNAFHVANADVVPLIQQAAAATDRSKQDDYMKQVAKIVVTQAYFVITNFGSTNYIVNSKKIAGMQLAPLTSAASIYGIHAP